MPSEPFAMDVASPSLQSKDNSIAITPLHIIPNHSKEWVPFCSDEIKPQVGMKFSTLEEGITYYENYAKLCGFTTRMSSTKKNKIDGAILFKYCLCSKEGFKETPKQKEHKRKRTITRVGCRARVTFKLCKEGGYIIFAFHEGHSHVLSTPTSMHHVKQSRHLTLAHKKYILDNARANVGATKSYRLMKEHLGSYHNVGASMVDFKNFQRDVRKHIRGKDAQMLIETFKRKKEICSSFFYDYEVDKTNHLTRVFWADQISRKNYAAFGDVVSFDTTFSMNEYSMVFAPFTGIDNHKSCVTFGAGLISHEDEESFVWLFNAFRSAMNNCDPVCLITDQDPAMKKAIERVFDEKKTKHRLCMWHIMKKLTDKVGLSVGEEDIQEFLSSFTPIVWSKQLEPEEFDDLWNATLEKYGLVDNKWLQGMFKIRRSWIPAYYRDVPMSGIMRTTSRSESENNFFGHFTTPHLTLFEFWMRYQSSMDAQRHKQSKFIIDSKSSMPQRKTPLDLEIDASELYTHSVFYDFQKELVEASFHCGCQSMVRNEDIDNICIIDRKRNDKLYMIEYNRKEMFANCSCKMFVREGIPCRHILWVLKDKSMKNLPKGYIKSRWTKTAMTMPIFDLGGNLIEETSAMDDVKKKVGDLWPEIFSCVSLAEQKEEYLDEFIKMIESFKQELIRKGIPDKSVDKNKEMESLLECPIPDEVTILDPNKCKNKGTQKRIKGKKEEVMEQREKPMRLCKACGELSHHDSRNCPEKKKKKDNCNLPVDKQLQAITGLMTNEVNLTDY